jgi:transposase
MPATAREASPEVEQLALLEPPPDDAERAAPKPLAGACRDAARGRRYKRGFDPSQMLLLPQSYDDFIDPDSAVRAIADYVDALVDLAALGFKHATGGHGPGQPPFHPGDLLKLYIYGYLNGVRSSRRLARECRINVELIWLLGGLRPGYHTIADFRKDNIDAIKRMQREFLLVCSELKLIGGREVGIDGSFFNADASARSVQSLDQLKLRAEALEKSIASYYAELDAADASEDAQGEDAGEARIDTAQLDALKSRAAETRALIEDLQERGETQHSRTDPDARRLHKRGKSLTGYNVQSAVDGAHKLIIAHDLTNAGNDEGQLLPLVERTLEALDTAAPQPGAAHSPESAGAHAHSEAADTVPTPAHVAPAAMAEDSRAEAAPASARPAAGSDAAEAPAAEHGAPIFMADAGYFTGADIAACEARGLEVYVPIPDTHSSAARNGRIGSDAFHYDAEADLYRCPGDGTLHPVGKPTTKKGVQRQRYQSDRAQCAGCPLRDQCLPEKTPVRQIYRSEHAASTERHRQRMDTPEAKARMRRRSGLCEHPFGTIKRSLGWDHFLLRGFHKAAGELSLIVQMYNFRRILTILGVDGFRAFCAQRRRQAAAEQGADSSRVFPPRIRPLQTLWAAICAFASLTPASTPLPRAPLSGAPAAF